MSPEALHDRRILLGVTGSIAAYKAAALASRFVRAGAEVTVLMTRAARKFITPLTFESLTRRPVVTDLFRRANPPQPVHVSLADGAALLVIAPASAQTIARLAGGFADDILSCTALSVTCPVLIAPAMDLNMYAHPATQDNLRLLAGRGVHFIGPAEGRLASGKSGKGRMAEPEIIFEAACGVLEGRPPEA